MKIIVYTISFLTMIAFDGYQNENVIKLFFPFFNVFFAQKYENGGN